MALQTPYIQRTIGALSEKLRGEDTTSKKEEAIFNHLKSIENDSRFVLDIEFPPNLIWFNINKEKPLSFSSQLKGKITILDFFTYCCINCIHILPDLHRLEQQYTDNDGVVIVGVHSSKFPNEKNSFNILNAILRYDITHPVVNDANIELWERLAVSCWPTLVILGPNQRLLHYIIGEGHGSELEVFIKMAVQFYKSHDLLDNRPIGIALERHKHTNEGLKFPGKIATNPSIGHIYVADSSNHRVLIINTNSGLVEQVYGSGLAGSKDGTGQNAEFNTPQGVIFNNGCLFVADTYNHLIRKIDLSSHRVQTIAGTGHQGDDKSGGKIGQKQEISSPWDLAVGPDSSNPTVLYIAMAGTHQIWAYFLKDIDWFKTSQHTVGTVVRMCGSGEEANRNNSFPYKAALAQPSGLALNTDGTVLFVADSESSTIRGINTTNGSVTGLVGGALDPMDLFAFGDEDGKGRNVRLQHPLGVAWDSTRQLLYVADSYNHKIKAVNPVTKTCSTLAGTGSPGLLDESFDIAQFSEPGGLCMGDNEGKTLLVADTNNHCIRILELESQTVRQFKLHFPAATIEMTDAPSDPSNYIPLTGKRATRVTFDPVSVPFQGEVTLTINISLSDDYKLNEERPSLWQYVPTPADSFVSLSSVAKGTLQINCPIELKLKLNSNTSTSPAATSELAIKTELAVFYCSIVDDTCLMEQLIFIQPLILTDTMSNQHIRHSMTYKIED